MIPPLYKILFGLDNLSFLFQLSWSNSWFTEMGQSCPLLNLCCTGMELVQPHSKLVWRVRPLCFARAFAEELVEEWGQRAERYFAVLSRNQLLNQLSYHKKPQHVLSQPLFQRSALKLFQMCFITCKNVVLFLLMQCRLLAWIRYSCVASSISETTQEGFETFSFSVNHYFRQLTENSYLISKLVQNWHPLRILENSDFLSYMPSKQLLLCIKDLLTCAVPLVAKLDLNNCLWFEEFWKQYR